MSFSGRISTSGNSEAIRLDKSLFKQHPEFKQQARVRADVIGPGTMLIRVIETGEQADEGDPFVGAFLSFLEKDSISHPESVYSIEARRIAEIDKLIEGLDGSDGDLG